MYDSHLKLEFRKKQKGEYNSCYTVFMLHYSLSLKN